MLRAQPPSPCAMSRKQRPTAVDEFVTENFTEDELEELNRISGLPNTRARDIHEYLGEFGFTGSLSSVYSWWNRVRATGAKAERFNQLLEDYQGADHTRVLNKVVVVLHNQLDDCLTRLETSAPAHPKDYLRLIPELGRNILAISQFIEQNSNIKDRRDLELGGAARALQELRLIFADSPFEEALEEGIKSVMQRLEAEGQR